MGRGMEGQGDGGTEGWVERWIEGWMARQRDGRMGG